MRCFSESSGGPCNRSENSVFGMAQNVAPSLDIALLQPFGFAQAKPPAAERFVRIREIKKHGQMPT
jgi:hypothetical protein